MPPPVDGLVIVATEDDEDAIVRVRVAVPLPALWSRSALPSRFRHCRGAGNQAVRRIDGQPSGQSGRAVAGRRIGGRDLRERGSHLAAAGQRAGDRRFRDRRGRNRHSQSGRTVPEPLVAASPTEKVPETVGVPESKPVEVLNDKPAGNPDAP